MHIDPVELRPVLEAQGIVHVREDELTRCCREAAQGRVDDCVVARGRLPVPGRDARLEFLAQPATQTQQYREDRQGRIDFRQAGLFENVYRGQHIAVFHPMIKGEDGFTVRDQPLEAPAVEDRQIICGQGVRTDESGRHFYADQDGLIIFREGNLSVSGKLDIRRNVDFEVGNIDFVGQVAVHGDVVDGFQVIGKKGIRIAGNAGACHLESNGDIDITGMTGKDGEQGGQIRCRGNLTARYLNDAHVECSGNILVKNEIIRSHIKCLGLLEVEGTITGGRCVALGGIQAGRIGTPNGMPTEVVAGIDYHYLDRIERLQDELLEVRNRLEEIDRNLGQYADSPAAEVPASLRKRVQSLQQEKAAASENEQKLVNAIAAVQADAPCQGTARINVLHIIHNATTVRMGTILHRIVEEMPGPFSLIELRGRDLHATGLTPLHADTENSPPTGRDA
jgi:uncharacterized protein (DUF342 family)